MAFTARQVLVGTILTLLMCSPAAAQQRGSIAGKVLDAGGLPLPGATVSVSEQSTGFTRTVVTADTGAYSVPNLEPGVYTVVVEMPGFAGMKQTDVRLSSGLNIPLDIHMQVAGVREEVTVTAQTPLVETSNSQIGGTLSSREIEDVPSNFRNFTALTQLIPGITPNPAASTFEGGQVVANGTPSQQNVYLLDGMYNNDDRLGGSQVPRCASCSITSRNTRCCRTRTARNTAAAPAPSSTWSHAAAPITSTAASIPTSATTNSTPAMRFFPERAQTRGTDAAKRVRAGRADRPQPRPLLLHP